MIPNKQKMPNYKSTRNRNKQLDKEDLINVNIPFKKAYTKYEVDIPNEAILNNKNDDNNFISFGNFDLCLKPGRQLLQLDEGDNNFLITENDNYIIKLIIKETYGDKRTYINNIYLYENIDFMASGIINTVNTFETIKEEDDSSSIFSLSESRERT